jgi:hypothetical protein
VSEVPRFAVVGRVNKGKSSIVAALAEDDSVHVDAQPGTTTEVREYPVRVDGRTLFVLLDTPGFEDAARALAWLRARERSAADRPALIADFVAAHRGTTDFIDEQRLLTPVIEGASILYVVDATRPYRRNYEAEMEILRWTGQPGMALLNRIGPSDHSDEWRRALDQYFKIVRDFDAFSVGFAQRLGLLETFRELRPAWRAPIDEAVAALVGQRRRRRAEAAAEIATLLADALTHTEETVVAHQGALEAQKDLLEQRFHQALREREAQARHRVETLFSHHEARFLDTSLERPLFHKDLFAEETWKQLGLSPGQLLTASALAGAAVGGTIDAMVGGASFLTGTVLGGALGGATALYSLGRRWARATRVRGGGASELLASVRQTWAGGPRYRVGPHADPNFPWVLLDRALLHYSAVTQRTHAHRGEVALPGTARAGLVAGLGVKERQELEGLFRRLRRRPEDPGRELLGALERAVARLVERVEPGSEEPSSSSADSSPPRLAGVHD